jgi:LysM repeat protein
LRIPPTPTPTVEAALPVEPQSGLLSATENQTAAVITVAAGDTLYSIAQRHGVSWDQVAEANGLAAPNQIAIGQLLKIPADAPGPTPDFTHQVHRGETLTGIARQYGLSSADLASANGLAAPFVIFPGQELAIPGGEE